MPTSFQSDASKDLPAWPAWLEATRVNDNLTACAYDATPPSWRTAIKASLALAHFYFGESSTQRAESIGNSRLGFRRTSQRCPAPWALIVFSQRYAAAARLAAACAAAIFAEVPQVGAICLDGEPQTPALVSLELCGVEDIFQPDATNFAALLDELAENLSTQGRIVIFHEGELDKVAGIIRQRCIPCYEERCPPHLRVDKNANIDIEILAFAHGGKAALNAALLMAGRPDAVFCNPPVPLLPAPDSELTLCPGCECFWLHPGLDPDFFTISRQIFAPWMPLTNLDNAF